MGGGITPRGTYRNWDAADEELLRRAPSHSNAAQGRAEVGPIPTLADEGAKREIANTRKTPARQRGAFRDAERRKSARRIRLCYPDRLLIQSQYE